MPYFSVIIPTYNRASIIDRAINAVLQQSFDDVEIIVVDDGSTDATAAVVRSISSPKLTYIYQENKGVCAARNLGASKATGKYLLFYDSDDLVLPTALLDFKNANIDDAADLLFGDVEKKVLNKNASTIIKSSNPYGNNKGTGLYLAGSFCIATSFFEKLGGYDENIRFGENTELRFRIDLIKPKKVFTNSIVLIYEVSTDGGSANLKNKIISNHYIMNKHGYYFKQYPKVKQMYFQNNAIAYFELKQYRNAILENIKAWYAYPKNIKTAARTFLMCFPFIYNKRLH
jgi:glycosyltransferase involved in cell wall biosynthesis